LFEAPICLKKIYSVLGNQGQPWLATKDGNRMRQDATGATAGNAETETLRSLTLPAGRMGMA